MSELTASPKPSIPFSQRIDVPLVTSFVCILVLLIIGSMIQPGFLSPAYLLQQFKVGAFLGIVATGAMLVILLGQIDLSVPWTLTMGAMMGAAAASYGVVGEVVCHSVRHSVRRGSWPHQRRGRRLSAHPLDDHHAGGQRRRAGADGRLFGRLLAAGFRDPCHALAGFRQCRHGSRLR